MLISVVIPTYNRANYVGRAIFSILQQTEQRFEIIVVDDGSVDNTKRVVEVINDPRIRYIKQENGGGSKARNTGIDNSKGVYIAFLDSDDIFLPFHLEQSLSILEDKFFNVVYSQIIVNRGSDLTFIKPPRPIGIDESVGDYLLSDRGFMQTSTLVVDAKLAKRTLFNAILNYGQDTDFAVRLSANGAVFKMTKKPSVIWSDEWSNKRISGKQVLDDRLSWLNGVKSILSDRAYYADLGWPVAKSFSRNGKKIKAICYYLNALFRGCFSFKLSIVIFLQIMLSKKSYRKFSDFLVRLGFRP